MSCRFINLSETIYYRHKQSLQVGDNRRYCCKCEYNRRGSLIQYCLLHLVVIHNRQAIIFVILRYSSIQFNTFLPMNPAGKVGSVRTLASTLIRRCFTIFLTSSPVSAYLSLFLRNTTRGMHSLSLWGPGEGLGAYMSRGGREKEMNYNLAH